MTKSVAFLLAFLLFVPGAFGGEEIWVLRLKEELIDLQNREPLALAKFVACSDVKGYGEYTPLLPPKVEGDGELLFYYEPVNYFTKREGGIYEVWLQQDVVVLDQKGREVFRREGTMELHFRKRSPLLDLYAVNRLTLKGLPPGRYTFRLVLHDVLKGEKASFDHPFEVVAGGP